MNDFLHEYDVDMNFFDVMYPHLNSDSQSNYYNIDNFRASIDKSHRDVAVFNFNVRSLY